ncbi:MAG: TlpA family protein disulfide reductase [Anaerolineae bacterium]
MLKRIFWTGLLMIVSSVLAACSTAAAGPEFPMLDGDTTTLADYEGQVVVVNFWATWCGPCRVEMPTLQAFYEEHGSGDFELLAVNIGETPETAQGFVDEGGFTFPIVLDPNGTLYDYFGVRGQPSTFELDRSGEIVFSHTGLITREQIDEAVLPLLEES